MGACDESFAASLGELLLVQILVVVATEVEKGSM